MSLDLLNRRQFLKAATGSFALATIFPSNAIAAFADQRKVITLNNLHTGETLQTCYFDGANFVESELDKINHLCRDFRRNEVFPLDKKLLTQLDNIQTLLKSNAEVQIISGYRSPATNEALRSKSNGVAKKSFHMQGKALDFRLVGVDLKDVRKAALQLKSGGVGYYPGSNFIHIDTGRVRSW